MECCITGHRTSFLEKCFLLRCYVLWRLIAIARSVGETSCIWVFYTKTEETFTSKMWVKTTKFHGVICHTEIIFVVTAWRISNLKHWHSSFLSDSKPQNQVLELSFCTVRLNRHPIIWKVSVDHKICRRIPD